MVRRRIHLVGRAVALLALAALPLAAQSPKLYREGGAWVEETTGAVAAGKVLRVVNQAGSVRVEGGTQSKATYTIRKRAFVLSEEEARGVFQSFQVTRTGTAEKTLVEGRWIQAVPRKFSAEISVQVPQGTSAAYVHTKGGDLWVRNIAATVEARSGGGSMHLSDISGPVTAHTSGGSVEVSNVPRELNLRTGGGAIKIHGQTGRISAETGGGNILVASSDGALLQSGGGSIQVTQCGSQLTASTTGGSIDVGQVKSAAVLQTGGGNIRLGGAGGFVTANTTAGAIELFKLMDGVRAETGSGAITAELLGVATKDSLLQSSLGDIVIYLAPQSRFTVQASIQMANGHRIRSEFSGLKVQSEGNELGPRNVYAEGALNGGGPVLKVSTVSGNIEFRRAGK